MYLVILRRINNSDIYDTFLGCYKNKPNLFQLKVTRCGAYIDEDTVRYLEDETLLIKKIDITAPVETVYLLCDCINSMGANARVYKDEFLLDRETAISKTGKISKFICRRAYSLEINYNTNPVIVNLEDQSKKI